LLAEIERVIFQTHPVEDRMGASSFRELLDVRAARARGTRERQQQVLDSTSELLTTEWSRKAQLPSLTKQWNDKKQSIEKDKKERKALTNKSSKERADRLEELSLAVDELQRKVQDAQNRRSHLLVLQEDARDIRLTLLTSAHREGSLAGSLFRSGDPRHRHVALVRCH
jgi:hypothetical protein